ncbi:unnamed protein product [Chondrus crispus]|uniref:Surfeit locus protein 2 n=1 Tax=Chondrus crispus TaxID=2769 RepID=R7Q9F3_CHOCR|nr:unnamed protein product [Chondrus crispus]CDF34689.1 unnamed protein product [Chondrus crispus]|eukprot:XP_005714508.1 unnamed protein product [Chondrus crispus]
MIGQVKSRKDHKIQFILQTDPPSSTVLECCTHVRLRRRWRNILGSEPVGPNAYHRPFLLHSKVRTTILSVRNKNTTSSLRAGLCLTSSQKMPSQSDVARYAAKHPSSTTLLPSGKLQFTKSGMEFAAMTSGKVLEAYANGLAYKRALQLKANEGYDFAQHEPYVVPHKHKDKNHFLFCKLTSSVLPRRKDVVIGHVNGKRFQRKFKEADRQREEAARIAAKRKEKKLARAKSMGKKEGENHNGGEGENGEEEAGDKEAPDLLDGILSDADEDMGDGDEDANNDGKEEDTGDEEMEEAPKQTKLDERISEDEKDGAVFWTRGRRRARAAANRDAATRNASENGMEEGITIRKSRSKAKGGKRVVPSSEITMGANDDAAAASNGHQEGEVATKKRLRSEKAPKKARRPRQRRKSDRAEA